MTSTVDVVIVGSGAGGSSLACAFADARLRVVVLEKGPRYERADYAHDELLGEFGSNPFAPSIDDDPHVIIEHAPAPSAPRRTLDGWSACCVGGGTSHMGASLHRLHPTDFHLRSALGPFEEIADWPYDYDALEPFYTRAEWLLGVSGASNAGGGALPRSRGLPMPPLRSHRLARRFDEACRLRGLAAYATPRAINSTAYDGRPSCEYCDFCAGFGCPSGARGSMQETMLRRAEATGRCQIVPGAMVTEVLLDRLDRARGVRFIDGTGAERVLSADVVCICCSAVESARLLLLSTSTAHTDGIGNGNGLVGRHLHFHVSSSGRGIFPSDASDADSRNPFLGRSLMDFYFLPPGVAELPKGGLQEFDLGRRHPIAAAREAAFAVGADGDRSLVWGAPLKESLRGRMASQQCVDFEVFQDGFPCAGSYMELDPEVRDRWGLPVARIHCTEVDHYRTAGTWLVDRGRELLSDMGAVTTHTLGVGTRNGYMAHGTCRAGADPRTSVLDSFCRVHGIRNLFVIDGSFMPVGGAAPATLTIVANALRCADYVIDRARCRAL